MLKKRILVIHGPNLNLLGERETSVYGKDTLEHINNEIKDKAKQLNLECDTFQSNIEGELINTLHSAMGKYDGIIINAGAYTHYSISIRDAIAAIRIPCVEVHLSNIQAREEFRHKSIISPVCVGQVVGFGKYSYIMALHGLKDIL